MKAVILSVAELLGWVDAYIPHGIVRATLFIGDRISCLDEAVGLEVDGEIVGVATIAPKGEQLSGQSTIVAAYVRHEFRNRGLGTHLLMVAVDRCRERDLTPVRVDALTTAALRIVEKLPEDYRRDVRLFDVSLGGMFDWIMQT